MKVQFNCDYCGKEANQPSAWFKRTSNHFCSRECSYKFRYENGRKTECIICGKFFTSPTKGRLRKSCSTECYRKILQSRVEKKCLYCNNNFIVKSAHKEAKFCSRCCADKYRTEKSRFSVNCSYCNNELIRKNRDRHLNKEKPTKHYFCNAKCRTNYFSGINSPLYKSSATHKNDFALYSWSYEIKKRDMKCVECGAIKGLQAHHVLSKKDFPEKKYDLDNGVTLCLECHSKRHPELSKNIFSVNTAKFTDIRNCKYCSNQFVPRNTGGKYCSLHCAKQYRKWLRNQRKTG